MGQARVLAKWRPGLCWEQDAWGSQGAAQGSEGPKAGPGTACLGHMGPALLHSDISHEHHYTHPPKLISHSCHTAAKRDPTGRPASAGAPRLPHAPGVWLLFCPKPCSRLSFPEPISVPGVLQARCAKKLGPEANLDSCPSAPGSSTWVSATGFVLTTTRSHHGTPALGATSHWRGVLPSSSLSHSSSGLSLFGHPPLT